MGGLISRPSGPLSGTTSVPGDKSISHRALMFGALAIGETTIRGLLEGEDVLRTAAALRLLGAEISRGPDGTWHVHGVGVGGLTEPADVLDFGNSGTGARLMMGLLATHPLTAFMTGDASLRSRPMGRVATPLAAFGATILAREGGRLPLAVVGARDPVPTSYEPPVASAQVKSAVLLAGLNTPGVTTVVERRPTRDHTELMLRHFGAKLSIVEADGGGQAIALDGQPELTAQPVVVPGDPSSAAFLAVAALLVPGSEIRIDNVGMNSRRAGLFETLREMGADIVLVDERMQAGEPVADMIVRAGPLHGIDVPPERAPSMIDEYPVLAMAAAVAEGETRMNGVGELRVKESDRLRAVAEGLAACGVRVAETEDSLTVYGSGGAVAGGAVPGGATVATRLDHRIAMSFLVLGLAARAPIAVDDAAPIATSFPGFAALLNGLGARLEPTSGPVAEVA